MRHEVLDDLIDLRVGIKLLIVGQPEEAAIRIETGFEEFGQELAEEAAAVDAGLVESGRVGQHHSHLQTKVRL